MSKVSRDLLLSLWQDEANDKHIRAQAFSLWAATQASDDIGVLRAAKLSNSLADDILQQRLIRGDQLAIPDMIPEYSRRMKRPTGGNSAGIYGRQSSKLPWTLS